MKPEIGLHYCNMPDGYGSPDHIGKNQHCRLTADVPSEDHYAVLLPYFSQTHSRYFLLDRPVFQVPNRSKKFNFRWNKKSHWFFAFNPRRQLGQADTSCETSSLVFRIRVAAVNSVVLVFLWPIFFLSPVYHTVHVIVFVALLFWAPRCGHRWSY